MKFENVSPVIKNDPNRVMFRLIFTEETSPIKKLHTYQGNQFLLNYSDEFFNNFVIVHISSPTYLDTRSQSNVFSDRAY